MVSLSFLYYCSALCCSVFLMFPKLRCLFHITSYQFLSCFCSVFPSLPLECCLGGVLNSTHSAWVTMDARSEYLQKHVLALGNFIHLHHVNQLGGAAPSCLWPCGETRGEGAGSCGCTYMWRPADSNHPPLHKGKKSVRGGLTRSSFPRRSEKCG